MIRINMDDHNITPEDSKRLGELCDEKVSISVPVGTIMVVETLLKEVCDKLAIDALQAVAENDVNKAGVLSTLGMEIVTIGKAMEAALKDYAGFAELKAIAERSRGEQTPEGGQSPLDAFLAKRAAGDTLQ